MRVEIAGQKTEKTKVAGSENAGNEAAKPKKNLLLHSCCAPCSTAVIERLIENYHLSVFFYNPNITNEGEYRKRLETQAFFLERYNAGLPEAERIELIEGDYEPEIFLECVRGLEEEPENGARCSKCFELRMKKTAIFAKSEGYDIFTTTLSVSPHKKTETINKIGHELQTSVGIDFLDESFKKKDGYRRSVELSHIFELYRQNYCGCIFSERPGAGAEDSAVERGLRD